MYTGKIINKTELPNGQVELTVEFSDGVDTETRTVIPQDRRGFEYWVTDVAKSLTTAKELKEEDNVGKVVEITTPQLTKAELDRNKWMETYFLLERLEKLAEKNILTGPRLTALNNKISTAKSFLDTNAKAEYLDFI